jgi:hypothetical protein
VHAEDASYDAAQKTRTFFAEEIDIYLFSIEYELVDLQIHMSRKLRSYPVFASEIGNLITKLYSTDNKALHKWTQLSRDLSPTASIAFVRP